MNEKPYLLGNPNGRWDSLAAKSNWHWDTNNSEKDYQEICTFQGNWDSLVSELSPLCKPNHWYDILSDIKIEDNDAVSDQMFCGLDVNQELYSTLEAGEYKIFQEIAKVFGMEQTHIRLTVQRPGQVCQLHIDKMGKIGRLYRDTPNRVRRFIVALDDWHWGQIYNIGNQVWQWKKGQCMTWNWADVPHGTANFGWWDRPLLTVIGMVTEKTQTLVNNGNYKNIFVV